MRDPVDYRPLLEEIRDIVRELRLSDPEASSLRRAAAKLKKQAGYEVSHRSIKRVEEEALGLELGYVLAWAIAADVEIVIGREPRVLGNGIEERARDFIRTLRMSAAQDRTITPAQINDLRQTILEVVSPRTRRTGS